MTAALPPLPRHLQRAAAEHRLRQLGIRHPRSAARELVRWIAPRSWQPTPKLRTLILDQAVARGDPVAAQLRLVEPIGAVGGVPARRRADALEVLAARRPAAEALADRAVAAFLREPRPPRETAGRGTTGAAAEAIAAAARLRAAGHARPRCVATLPALEGNPFSALMELAYERHGLAPVHVDTLEDAGAVIEAGRAGAFDPILHVNASNRLIWSAPDAGVAAKLANEALARIDAWRASGLGLVVTVHDGPILDPEHTEAERALAQGILDRADRVHVLTASTPRVLGGWLRFDPARTVHLPHPNYDGVYADRPPRAQAREAIGVDPTDPAEGGTELIMGVIGILSARKGVLRLLDALATIPDPLPGGYRLRLVIGGRVVDPGGEELIRAAHADPRVIPVFGTVPAERMPLLLAAIDVAIVPYVRYLNSGWTVLALSAGIPVVAPAGGTASEVVRPGALLTFDSESADGLAAAINRASSLAAPAARTEARRSVDDLDAETFSDRFASLLAGVPIGH